MKFKRCLLCVMLIVFFVLFWVFNMDFIMCDLCMYMEGGRYGQTYQVLVVCFCILLMSNCKGKVFQTKKMDRPTSN